MFIGRKNELRELQDIYNTEGFKMILVYGDRGAGKTTLLEEFCKDKDNIFFKAREQNGRVNLNQLSQLVYEHYGDKNTQPFPFWENAFTYIKEKQQGKKIVVVIDNFQEIAERNLVFMNVLCSSAENELKYSNILLILTSVNSKFTQKYLTTSTQPISKILSAKIYIEKFLNDETIEKLKSETMRSSKLSERAKFIRVNADEVIQREGNTSSDMYKIISGVAICYLNYGTDKEYLIRRIKNGASFGEFQILSGKPAPYTIVAFSDMLLLKISQDEFDNFISMNMSNSIDVMRSQAKMIDALRLHIDMLVDESQAEQ